MNQSPAQGGCFGSVGRTIYPVAVISSNRGLGSNGRELHDRPVKGPNTGGLGDYRGNVDHAVAVVGRNLGGGDGAATATEG